MKKTAVIVQARLGSSRLPAKVLLPLPTGRTVLEEVLHRCKQIPGVDVVVCAIPEDDWFFIQPIVEKVSASLYGHFGAEDDVLGRYTMAAHASKADVVMRITADCPMLDPDVCGAVLNAFNAARDAHGGTVHYCSNTIRRTYPQGFDCEVFSREFLDRANKEAPGLYQREHVTPWMFEPERIESCRWIEAPNNEDRSHLRWTLDTLEDYRRIWDLMNDARSDQRAA